MPARCTYGRQPSQNTLPGPGVRFSQPRRWKGNTRTASSVSGRAVRAGNSLSLACSHPYNVQLACRTARFLIFRTRLRTRLVHRPHSLLRSSDDQARQSDAVRPKNNIALRSTQNTPKKSLPEYGRLPHKLTARTENLLWNTICSNGRKTKEDHMISTKNSIKWLISILIPVIVYFISIDASDILHQKAPLFFAITTWAVVAWIVEVIPSSVVACLLTLAYALFVTKPSSAFGPWTTFMPWFVLAGLIIADVMERTGLGKRIALKGMLIMGGSLNKTLIGLGMVGILLAVLVPAGQARGVIFIAIAQGLCSALNLDPRSRMSSAIIMAGFFAAIAPNLFCMPAGETNLQVISVVKASLGVEETWFNFFKLMAPFNFLYVFGSMFLVLVIKGKENFENESNLGYILEMRLKEMGPITKDELKVLAVLLIGMVVFLTEKWHGLPGAFCFAFVGMLCFMPGINLSDQQTMRRINLSFLLFLSGCMSIGFVANDMNVPAWASSLIMPILHDSGTTNTVTLSYVFGVLINFLMTPMAAVSAMGSSLGNIALDLGLNPYAVIYPFLYGLDQYIFPYEIGYLLYAFMTGAVTLKHIVPALLIRMLLMLLLIPFLLLPYWKLIGFVSSN